MKTEEAVFTSQTRLTLGQAQALTPGHGPTWLGNFLNKHGLKPIVQGESGTPCDFPAAFGKGRPPPCRHTGDTRPPAGSAVKLQVWSGIVAQNVAGIVAWDVATHVAAILARNAAGVLVWVVSGDAARVVSGKAACVVTQVVACDVAGALAGVVPGIAACDLVKAVSTVLACDVSGILAQVVAGILARDMTGGVAPSLGPNVPFARFLHSSCKKTGVHGR